jgi:adenosylcobinamide kinase/adenosylcobinamide-phosphate guanylyltransferase
VSKKLILGGARSGKSKYAEAQALDIAKAYRKKLIYVATATPGDDEMRSRIHRHKGERSEQWQVIEEPICLAGVLSDFNDPSYCILIDCLTLWMTNNLINKSLPVNKVSFLESIKCSQATILMVSNEVGSGIVPLGALSREFVDESGWLHQELSLICDEVVLIVAGLPLVLKKN